MDPINFSSGELRMWAHESTEKLHALPDWEINEKYSRRELRIVTENNREQLPNFVEAFRRQKWMDLRPFYQRRPRWDKSRQSKLIESFIMNVPVPPLFVYESEFARYEVMDGQQRITAILDFYSNRLRLQDLEQWPELNGRIYDDLPREIKRGIDRRSISYIVLLKESASTSEEETLLRQQVFERLNTGGVALSNQEVRNSIYFSPFSELLEQLAALPPFRVAWEIPTLSYSPSDPPPEALAKNRLFSTMKDTEIVLRFFALRHISFAKGGMKTFLDRYMLRARTFRSDDIEFLRDLFEGTLYTCSELFRDHLFHTWISDEERWSPRPQIALADAVMVACSRYLSYQSLLIIKREEVVEETKKLFHHSPPWIFTGQRNTRADVENRIALFDKLFRNVIKHV